MITYKQIVGFVVLLLNSTSMSIAENGYDLWLRYVEISDPVILNQYKLSAKLIVIEDTSETMRAIKKELSRGLDGLLGQTTPVQTSITENGAIVVGCPSNSTIINALKLSLDTNTEAYQIISTNVDGHSIIAVGSSGETGALYGTFHLLRLMQTGQSLSSLNISERPLIKRRLLNHWDNLNDSIERGYAGTSLWKWKSLPEKEDKRYTDYARACASIGINGTVLNNVNADPIILSPNYLSKVKVLADIFRPFGIKVYLSANFAAPQRIGGLGTADPVDESVISWWGKKCDEVYSYIPDFGGFLVKANSEGQPGPKTYNRTHAQGANCLANAIVHHGGIVIWRAFVYDDAIDSDRAKRAFKEFKSLDGKFHENVIVQVKNGPFDFQPREPVHPLFGGLTSTHVGGEFQITKEYLGQDVHLVYLAPYWKEVLDFDTYAKGKGSTVGKVLDGSVYNDTISCIAGVANTGSDINWCDHHFDQANWYAFGRLAWNYTLQSEEIADEWIKMTWSWKPTAVTTITKMMMGSHEACVNYMDPLGLCGLFMHESHYGPEPDYNSDLSHPDWNSLYWHKADNAGLGYDRTTGNSTYVNTYFPENVSKFKNISSCPPEYLCWFFHVPWDHTMTNGKLFWDELCYRYNDGLHYVGVMDSLQWPSLNAFIDVQRFSDVKGKLDDHYSNAKKWRDVCVNYFGKFSKMPIPPYKPITKINKQKRVLTGNYNPILVYDLQGKLLTTIIQENGITNIVNKNNIVRSLPSGMYILYQDGVKPSKLLVGARSLLFKGIYR